MFCFAYQTAHAATNAMRSVRARTGADISAIIVLMTILSAAQASRAIGAMFFAIFGAVWLMVWSQRAFGFQPGILAAIVAGTIVIFAMAWRQFQQNRSAHAALAGTEAYKKTSRIFNIVNVTQWAAILIVGNVLANIGLKDWVLAS